MNSRSRSRRGPVARRAPAGAGACGRRLPTGPSAPISVISSSSSPASMPVIVEDLGHLVDEVRLDELAGGQVDRHDERRAGRAATPGDRLATGGLEHPASERADQPGLLGHRDERERRDEAAGRVLPADERLEPDDAAVVRGRRSAGSGRGARRARGAARRSFSRSIRSSMAVLMVGSNRSRRRVGSSLARTIAISASRRSSSGVTRPASPTAIADRRADEPVAAALREGRAQFGREALGDPDGLRLVGDRVEDDPELVAAEAGHRVARAKASPRAAVRRPSAAGRRRHDRRSR